MSTDHNFGSERRAEVDSNRGPSAYQPTALPLGQTGSPKEEEKDSVRLIAISVDRLEEIRSAPSMANVTNHGRVRRKGVGK